MAGRSSRGFGKLSGGRQASTGRQIAFRFPFGFLLESECLLDAFRIPVGFILNSGCLREANMHSLRLQTVVWLPAAFRILFGFHL